MDHGKLRTAVPYADESPKSTIINPPTSLLLDHYEIERITRDLERFLLRSANDVTAQNHRRDGGGGGGGISVGRPPAVMKGLRRFIALQAVDFCGFDADSVVVFGGGRGK